MPTRRRPAEYAPGTAAAIAKADRVYTRRWLDAEHEYVRTADLRQAMWAFNVAVGSAAATWKQTVKEAIQQDNLF